MHVSGSIGDTVVGVCGNIFQQLANGGGCGFRFFSLLGSNDTEGNYEFIVYLSSIVE